MAITNEFPTELDCPGEKCALRTNEEWKETIQLILIVSVLLACFFCVILEIL